MPWLGAPLPRLIAVIYLDILQDIERVIVLTEPSQKRALRNYRKRIERRGLARFEVLGLKSDRILIRALAKRLAENDAEALRLRAAMKSCSTDGASKRGGILAALRRSPLVGAEIDIVRPILYGRDVKL